MASKACLTHPHIGEAIELAHFFGKLQRLPKKCTISFLQRPVSVSQHVEVFMFSNKKSAMEFSYPPWNSMEFLAQTWVSS